MRIPFVLLNCALALFAFEARASEMLPKYLYHFGPRDVLFKNVKLQNISQADWDQYIMPANHGHPEHRKGLYGGRSIKVVSFYGASLVAINREPWVMRIVLKDRCRTQEKLFAGFGTVDSVLRGSQKEESDKDYLITWMSQHRASQLGRYTARDFYELLYRTDSTSEEFGRLYKIALPIFGDFIKIHPEFSLIVDNSWVDSFYVRDRNCIEKIEGTVKDVFAWLSHKDSWKLEEKTAKYYKGGDNHPNYRMIKYGLASEALTVEWELWLRDFAARLSLFESVCRKNLRDRADCKEIRRSIDEIEKHVRQ